MDQWNPSKDPEINRPIHVHLIFDKERKTNNGKNRTSSTNGTGLIGYMHVKNENQSIFITFHKIQVQVDQGLQHKTKDKESHRIETGKKTWNV